MQNVDSGQNYPRISIIAAIGKNRVLGKNNKLLWQIPDDLKRFKELTLGHPVIMGRKTYESILASLGKPLPGRTNIVVTRNPEYSVPEGVIVAHSLPEALSYAKDGAGADEIFVGGGGQLYEAALPFVDRLYLTLIDDEQEGDSFFPAYEEQFEQKTFEESREWNGLKYTWVNLER
jgi:dihydrofolate reductase